jgi:hypothetical protein
MAPDGSQETAGSSREAKFRVGQHVRISKEKMKFAKAAKHNFSTEIFRIVKVIHRRPRVVYELEDLNRTPIDGQFYPDELTPVRITSRTTYKINKILDKRVGCGIPEVLVSWQGYGPEFDSWIPAASVKNILHDIINQQFFTLRCSATCHERFTRTTLALISP